MQTIDNLFEILVGKLTILLAPVVGWVAWRMFGIASDGKSTSEKLTEVEGRVLELEHQRELLDKKIAVMEKVLGSLEKIAPALQELTVVNAKLDTLLEATVARLEMLENTVYKVAHNFECPMRDKNK